MPARIRELRALIQSSLSTSYTAASNAAWAPGTATKFAVTRWNQDSAKQAGIPSAVMQQRIGGRPHHLLGLDEGNLEMGIYAGRGSADTTAPAEATLLAAFLGGLASPSTKTDTVEAGSTATSINCTAHGMSRGMAVLINGEVRRLGAVTTDSYALQMALSSVPSEGDAIVNSHTVYHDESATQDYLDLLAIGHNAEDQYQYLGAMGGFGLEGIGLGELPELVFDLRYAQKQVVPAAQRDQLEPGEAAEGLSAPAGKEHGGLYFGNWGSTTAQLFSGGNWNINPGLVFEMIENRNYANGIGGWKLVDVLPTFSFVTHVDSDYGLYADWAAKQHKQLLFQFGSTAQNCFAVSLPRCCMDSEPAPVAIGNLQGIAVEGHGAEPTQAAGVDNLQTSAISFHWF